MDASKKTKDKRKTKERQKKDKKYKKKDKDSKNKAGYTTISFQILVSAHLFASRDGVSVEGRASGWMDRQTDTQSDRWVGGRMDRQMDRQL